MKLLESFGPEPRAARMLPAEKGLTIPIVEVDLLGGETRRGTWLERNPGGQLPSPELDDVAWRLEPPRLRHLHP